MQIIIECPKGAKQSDYIVNHWEENGNLFGVVIRPTAGEKGRAAAAKTAKIAEEGILHFLNGEYDGGIIAAAENIVDTWQFYMRQYSEFADFPGSYMSQPGTGFSAPLSVAVMAGCSGKLSLIHYGAGCMEFSRENGKTVRFPDADSSPDTTRGFDPLGAPIYAATFAGKLPEKIVVRTGGTNIWENGPSDRVRRTRDYFRQAVSEFFGFDTVQGNELDYITVDVNTKSEKKETPEPAVPNPTPTELKKLQKAKERQAQLSDSLSSRKDELKKTQEKKQYWETQKENARQQYEHRLESIEKRRQYLEEKLASAEAMPVPDSDALAGAFLPCIVFSHSEIGNSHVKLGMPCEDASAYFCDPEGRYAIAVLCDGHSDPQCFRSAKGAELGCRSAVLLLRRFMDAYLEEAEQNLFRDKASVIDRLRRAFIIEWNRLVMEDLRANPLTEEEMQPLDNAKYRMTWKIYREGRALNNIYGTTMIAAAVCGDFHIVMQVGDGASVRLEYPGRYTSPLPDDAREGMVGPASLCDSDLTTRENAFRIDIIPGVPQALFGMSDGIGEWPLSSDLRERLRAVHEWLLMPTDGDTNAEAPLSEVAGERRDALQRFVASYTQQGVQDDCSLFGIICKEKEAAPVIFAKEEIHAMTQELEVYRTEAQRQYDTSLISIRKAMDDIGGKLTALQSEIDKLQHELDGLMARFPNLASAETIPSPEPEKDSGGYGKPEETRSILSMERQPDATAEDDSDSWEYMAMKETDKAPGRKEAAKNERTEAK